MVADLFASLPVRRRIFDKPSARKAEVGLLVREMFLSHLYLLQLYSLCHTSLCTWSNFYLANDGQCNFLSPLHSVYSRTRNYICLLRCISLASYSIETGTRAVRFSLPSSCDIIAYRTSMGVRLLLRRSPSFQYGLYLGACRRPCPCTRGA